MLLSPGAGGRPGVSLLPRRARHLQQHRLVVPVQASDGPVRRRGVGASHFALLLVAWATKSDVRHVELDGDLVVRLLLLVELAGVANLGQLVELVGLEVGSAGLELEAVARVVVRTTAVEAALDAVLAHWLPRPRRGAVASLVLAVATASAAVVCDLGPWAALGDVQGRDSGHRAKQRLARLGWAGVARLLGRDGGLAVVALALLLVGLQDVCEANLER
jgi:hypothetical protein